jgi:hypothetical protein
MGEKDEEEQRNSHICLSFVSVSGPREARCTKSSTTAFVSLLEAQRRMFGSMPMVSGSLGRTSLRMFGFRVRYRSFVTPEVVWDLAGQAQ